MRFKPQEGLEVIATGKLTTYPGSSKYQIVIEALEPAGIGALMALLEERKKKLAAEGLFDQAVAVSAGQAGHEFVAHAVGVWAADVVALQQNLMAAADAHQLVAKFAEAGGWIAGAHQGKNSDGE